MQPSVFYGTAVSTCLGLTLGLALHGPWQSRPGGPQILAASAAAAELARPASPDDLIEAVAPINMPTYADAYAVDIGQLPADSLPVVRLTRRGGQPMAAAEGVERIAADDAGPVGSDNDAVLTEPVETHLQPRTASRDQVAAAYGPADGGL